MYEIFGDCDSVRNMEIGSVLELDNWNKSEAKRS